MTDTSREAVAAAVAFLRQDLHEGRKAGDLLEAVAEARDVAVAQARYAAKALEAAANQRDEALAREAVLREALTGVVKGSEDYVAHTLGVSVEQARTVIAALDDTAAAAEARDAALIERAWRDGLEEGRREGIEEAAR